MSEGAAIGVLACALVIVWAIGTLVGAVFLRAAIAVYNYLAGGPSSPSSVPEPAFRKALWITFAISVIQLIVGLLIIGLAKGDGPTAPRMPGPVTQQVLLPVSLLVMAVTLSVELPTTFGRALLVTLCDLILTLLAGGVLVAIAVLVLGVSL
jgi:hypothetical protein